MQTEVLLVDLTVKKGGSRLRPWIVDTLFLGILILAACFRLTGLDWGETTYMHPDERFLLMVGSSLEPVHSLSEYFDTANSSLNPHNRGYTFYVYGTFPMFLTRYLTEWVYHSGGMEQIMNIGRPLSAFFDLLAVCLVYLTASYLYDRRVGLLASAFMAFAVLPIQLSHFFKEDTFLNFFTLLAAYFALRVATKDKNESDQRVASEGSEAANKEYPVSEAEKLNSTKRDCPSNINPYGLFINNWYLYIGFGIALGLAVACKINAAPVAMLLPLAVFIRLTRTPANERWFHIKGAVLGLVAAALVSLLVFRIFQPYAFSGPGFLGVKPNPKWVDNIREQRSQAEGDVDFPPALQWARRPLWFAWKNLVFWGLGMPLGLLAWAGFLWMAWRMYKGEWKQNLILWSWTAFYFAWQSLTFNPTMRYLLPIYPMLVIFAAWAVFRLWDNGAGQGIQAALSTGWQRLTRLQRPLAALIGNIVLVASFAWAFAFTQIYVQPFTRAAASHWIFENIPGPLNLHIQTNEGLYNQPLPFSYDAVLLPGDPYLVAFTPKVSGSLSEISAYALKDQAMFSGVKTLNLSLADSPGGETPLAEAVLKSDFLSPKGPEGQGYTFNLSNPVSLTKDQTYYLLFDLSEDGGVLTFKGASIANEGSWDDGLPLRVDGYDGFGGIYPPDVTFEMYTDDNPEKLARFFKVLDKADYLLITSNRQWGTLPRLPERFPLVTTYYRSLLGCPPERSLEWCYANAQPGSFRGNLGFELVKVFKSDPNLGPWRINDQLAEEAFTVYDHPKVFIFRKMADYNPEKVRDILGAVDLDHVMLVTPKKATSHPMNLMLPEERLVEQRLGGTWSDLFNSQAIHNRFEPLGVLLWYMSVMILGLLAYPLTSLALQGLSDRGYPLARMVGLLLLAYLVWLAGSFSIPVSRLTIGMVLVLMVLFAAALAYVQRAELRLEWQQRKTYFFMVELLALGAFLFVLFIRWGNPDLWHPWKGGEKPMDFSYFNAVLKSTTFPPYDPWFAGGYLNYYYYGFVIVGVLVKFLGIVPAFAYNLIIPTLFALIVLGAFSIGWNLLGSLEKAGEGRPALFNIQFYTGAAAAVGVALLGNLGTLRMIFRGYQMLAAPGIDVETANLLQRWLWAAQGFMRVLAGESLPYGIPDWYWLPSRVIAALGDIEPITEFPFFTVLYADLHAHLIALPVTLLALAWALSVLLGRGWSTGADADTKRALLQTGLGFLVGGLVIGALRPTNTWDLPTYLTLGLLAVGYTLWQLKTGEQSQKKHSMYPILWVIGAMALLIALALLLYQPYAHWYALSYTAADIWEGPRTPLWDYFTHWGLFLFVIITWMIYETIHWMATTPLSAMHKLKPYKDVIWSSLGLLIILTVALAVKLPGMPGLPLGKGIQVAWVALPLAAWAAVLLLRPNQPDVKRAVLFMVGTGLVLTLVVEIVVLRGDIGRMNTVFKFYMQAWTLFGISAAAAFGWTLASLSEWRFSWRLAWQLALVCLVGAAAIYPWMASVAKVKDRMALDAPHTLDGMAYMQHASYDDQGMTMDLSQDYHAIRWLQENVKDSPVIVEANVPEYRWGTRYTVYTGLPGVVGWNWHQRQQRAAASTVWVEDRVAEIGAFYLTQNVDEARRFLNKYDVSYIIVGQLERAYYTGAGLLKFAAMEGSVLKVVYHNADTTIYEVIRNR